MFPLMVKISKAVLQPRETGRCMKIDVTEELRRAGEQTNRHLEWEMSPIDMNGHSFVFTKPIIVDMGLVFDGEGFNLQGELHSELLMNCTRCNKEFKQPFGIEFSERFVKASQTEAEDEECYPFSGETLDLDQMILDLIILNAPVYGLCKEDCKGLCPVCGCDLNITQCSCSKTAESVENSPFKELAQLLKDE